MTNAEIIAKIRAEIERLMCPEIQYSMEQLLSLLSDLEKSLPAKVADDDDKVLEVEAVSYCFDNGLNISPRVATDFARHFYDLGCRRTAEKYDEIEYNRQRAEESEKPMNLEGEINRYLREECSDDDEPSIHEIAEHFAQWGAEHYLKSEFLAKFAEMTGSIDTMPKNTLPPSKECEKGLREPLVSDDLEEAAKHHSEQYRPHWPNQVRPAYDSFIAGAKWQKEQNDYDTIFYKGMMYYRKQMLEEAVEGEITKDNRGNNVVSAGVFNKDFEYGDKVRVIVCKKED